MQEQEMVGVSNIVISKVSYENLPLDITIYSDNEQKRMVWSKAFDAWILHFTSRSTKRVYKDGWRYFLQFSQRPPWEISRSIIVDYINYMRNERKLSDATIQQRLASLSSFYDFVCRDYTILHEGREIPLYDINPASSKILRKKVTPYQKANWLSKDEIKQFLNAIPKDTTQGLRDYSLFLLYILTGRRNSEIRNLKWGDINVESDGTVLYHWKGKYVADKKYEMAKPCYEAIVSYLKFSYRFECIKNNDYIFTAIDNHDNPLCLREIGRLLKKYCKLAGITKKLNCHSLRHSATVLRRVVGESLEDVSKFLAHASYSTTFCYLHGIEGFRDDSVKKVENLLEL